MELLSFKNDKDKLDFLNCGDFPVFFTESYHKFLLDLYTGTFFLKDEKGRIAPIAYSKKYIFNNAYLLFPVMKNGKRILPEEEKIFYNNVVAFLKKKTSFQSLMPYMPVDISYSYPYHSKMCEFGQYSIELENKTESELFSALSGFYRRIINKSNREGIYVKYGKSEFVTFYNIYKETLLRQNLYYDDISKIEKLYNSNPDNSICAVAYNSQNVPEGSLLILYTKYAGYALYGGSVSDNQQNGSVKLLHWEIIKKLKKLNVKTFVLGGARLNNIEGTKFQGIQMFKERFGADLKKGFLWKINLKNNYKQTYDLIIKAKAKITKQKYLPDIIDQMNKKV